MFKKFGKVFKKMLDSSETLESFDEFLNSYKQARSTSDRKQLIKDYLNKHFESDKPQKVKDFPTGSEWINTTEPLSIYKDLKGKLVLIDFFTYCCINCMHILPDLKTLEHKFSIEDGLVVLGVHYAKFNNEKQTGNILSAVKRYGIMHAVMNDSKGIVWDSMGINCWPSLVLLGPNAELLLLLRGEGHLELLNDFIGTTLSVMEKKNLLSNHSLPQIRITDELTSFSALAFPGKICCSKNGKILAVSDSGHHRLVVLNENGSIKHIIGGLDPGFEDGTFVDCKFNSPQGLVFKDFNIIYVADTENHAIREINLEENYVKTVAGNGKQGNDQIGGKLWTNQELSSPWDVSFTDNTDALLIAMAGHHQIWALYLCDNEKLFKKGKKGECRSIAGSGREENRNNLYPHAAAFAQPSGLAYCPDRHSIFIADSESSAIRELNLTDGKVSSVVGGIKNPLDLFAFGDVDGVGYDVKLQHPLGVAWDNNIKKLYVADSYNHKIKIIDLSKVISCTTLKIETKLNEPAGLCIFQNKILIADTNNNCIKILDPSCSSISPFPITVQEIQKPESINEEKNVEINTQGGQIKFFLKVNKPDTVSFTEDGPSVWFITFCDENWKTLAINEICEHFSPESTIVASLPKFQNQIKLLIKGSIHVCEGDMCSIQRVCFIANIKYLDIAEKNVSCDFTHVIS